jgi:hypothetical protein
MTIKTIKIKPSHESQGDHVLINEDDFDPEKHERFDEAHPSEKAMTVAEMRDALTAKGVQFDPALRKGELRALLETQA